MNDYEQLIEMMFADGTLDQSVRQEIEGMNDLHKRLHIVKILDKGLGLFTKIEGIINLPKFEYIKEVIKLLKDYVLVGEVKQKEAGEVMTPLWFVKEMLSILPEDVWTNPELKWLDPANGSGPYPILVIYKLMNSLKDFEFNEDLRYKHILENMIYVSELQPKNMFLYMNAVDPLNQYKLNVYTGSFLEKEFDCYMKSVWEINKIDIIVGNPPYQEMDGGAKASAKPIYNLFTEKGILISNQILFVTPSRWFAGGKGLDLFRKMMMESSKLLIINHFDDATKIFGKSVEIKGGVSYFLYDNRYNGLCYLNGNKVDLNKFDIIVTNFYSFSIISKILDKESISSICHPRSYFGIDINDKRVSDNRVNENYSKCYLSQLKGFDKWIDRTKVLKNSNNYRVVTPRAATKGGGGFGNLFITHPGEFLSDSYISFFVNTESEAESLMSYLKTNFSNFMLSIRKVSQSVKGDTCKWIPIVPFDRIWTDNDVFEYFKLNEEERKIISEFKF